MAMGISDSIFSFLDLFKKLKVMEEVQYNDS